MFEGKGIQDILIYIFIMGIVLEFTRMLPTMIKGFIKRIRRLKRKADIQEIAKELGGCQSDDECSKRLKGAFEYSIKSMGDSIKGDIKDARAEAKEGIDKVHERIDEHLNAGRTA